MDLRLEGKVAVLTGGSRGIGLAIARRFAEAGANVMLSSRKANVLAEAVAGLSGLDGSVDWVAAHAGDPEQAEAVVTTTIERFGRLDVLVNNAATNPHFGPMIEIDQPKAEKTVAVNQLGVLSWCQLAHKAWMRDHGGSIINLASVGGIRP